MVVTLQSNGVLLESALGTQLGEVFVGRFSHSDILAELLRARFQAKCCVYSISQGGIVRSVAAARISHHCITGIDAGADSQRKRQGVTAAEFVCCLVQFAQSLANPHHFLAADTAGFVEPDGHDGIPDVFVHPTAVFANDLSCFAEPITDDF